MPNINKKPSVIVIGGAGHIGLPLSLCIAKEGFPVSIYDLNKEILKKINDGIFPYKEEGEKYLLKKILKKKNFSISSHISEIKKKNIIIICIGTPIDEYMNPVHSVIKECIDQILPYLEKDQLIILRSSVSPKTTEWVSKYINNKKRGIDIAYCPERVVQGETIKEIREIPQIIGTFNEKAFTKALKIFSKISKKVVKATPLEAELSKLFCNAYRYIEFSISNQFYLISEAAGIDYKKINKIMKKDYSRASNIPSAGFSAGPCLFKDTMQLASFFKNQFSLGQQAMLVNEGLVLSLSEKISKNFDISKLNIGLLGMAFKADSDDIRDSLSYKLKKKLEIDAKKILATDPYVKIDENLKPIEEVINKSNLIILCSPHKIYKKLNLKGKSVIDIWGFLSSKKNNCKFI